MHTENLGIRGFIVRNKMSILKSIVGLFILTLIVARIDYRKSILLILQCNPAYLILVFILINADRFLMAYKWKILIRSKNDSIPLTLLARGYYLTGIFRFMLPATVGEDVMRGYSISKSGLESGDIISSIAMERILGTLSNILLSILTFVSLGFFFDVPKISIIVYCLVLSMVLLAAVFFASMSGRVHARLLNMNWMNGTGRVSNLVRNLVRSYTEYRDHPREIAVFFSLSMVEQLIPVIAIYLFTRALHINVSLMAVLGTIPTILLLSKLPISIGSLGVQEGLFILILSIVGISPADSFAISVLGRLAEIVSIGGGFLVMVSIGQFPLSTKHVVPRKSADLGKQTE
jgi:glycosyltransferase 2 family protein